MDANGYGTNLLSYEARVWISYGILLPNVISWAGCSAGQPWFTTASRRSRKDENSSAVQRLGRLANEDVA